MEFYTNAPILRENDNCPGTCRTARPKSPILVSDIRVAVVKQAGYRGATFDGIFALAAYERNLPRRGSFGLDVYCRWFGHRLATRPIRIWVDAVRALVIEHYEGPILTNLER